MTKITIPKYSFFRLVNIVFIFMVICLFTQDLSAHSKKSLVCNDCNVILISLDVLRVDHIGLYGYTRNTTPNIDGFFDKSVIFYNHFAHSPITLASHISTISSSFPQENGLAATNVGNIVTHLVTLPQVLKQYNFTTHGFVDSLTMTWSVNQRFSFGSNQGYDVYKINNNDNEQIIGFLNNMKAKNERFFLYLHPESPHDPYVSENYYKVRFVDLNYNGNIDSNPESYPDKDTQLDKAREKFWSNVNFDDPMDLKHLIDLYDSQIYKSDEFLGSIFRKLKDNNQLDNTVVILTSDHGEEFGEHGKYDHIQLYDETMHVPLLVRLPNKNNLLNIYALSQGVDVAPTILDLLNIKPENSFSGKSLMELINGKTKSVNDFVISQWSTKKAIRNYEWKLIMDNEVPQELYNIKTDPKEKYNLISSFPNVAKEMGEKLYSFESTLKPKYQTFPLNELEEDKRQKLIQTGYF